MDLQRSKVLLKKINALHDSADAFDGKFSKLERDLILQYVRDFYELLTTDEDSSVPQEVRVQSQSIQPVVAAPEPIVASIHDPIPAVIEAVVAPPPVPEVVTPTPQVKVALDAPEEEIVKEIEEKIEDPIVVPAAEIEKVDLSGFQTLFDDDQVKDVSSQFSLKPLADINKGMGINDKILMINSLFGGDQQLFSATVTQLNEAGSFDVAKQIVATGMAAKHDWLDENKIDTAKRFIHLIKRRYQS